MVISVTSRMTSSNMPPTKPAVNPSKMPTPMPTPAATKPTSSELGEPTITTPAYRVRCFQCPMDIPARLLPHANSQSQPVANSVALDPTYARSTFQSKGPMMPIRKILPTIIRPIINLVLIQGVSHTLMRPMVLQEATPASVVVSVTVLFRRISCRHINCSPMKFGGQ